MNRFLGIACVLFATVVVLGMLGVSARAQTPATPIPLPGPSGSSANPLDLFKEIYPVFSHPRCVNCHGVVETDPSNIRVLTGRGHGGGSVGLKDYPDLDNQCSFCHDTPCNRCCFCMSLSSWTPVSGQDFQKLEEKEERRHTVVTD